MLEIFGKGIPKEDGSGFEAETLDIEPTLDRTWANRNRADYLMWREEDKHFAIVEEKAGNDPSNAFCGLIQALQYLAVATTERQITRMKSLFNKEPVGSGLHVYVILWDFPTSRNADRPNQKYLAAHDELLGIAKNLAKGLLNPEQKTESLCRGNGHDGNGCDVYMESGGDAMIESIRFVTYRSENFPRREPEVPV